MLHAKDVDVERKRVTLSDTTRRGKSIKAFSIDEDCKTRGSDAGHDELNPIEEKVKEAQGFPDEAPFEPIKSFF